MPVFTATPDDLVKLAGLLHPAAIVLLNQGTTVTTDAGEPLKIR